MATSTHEALSLSAVKAHAHSVKRVSFRAMHNLVSTRANRSAQLNVDTLASGSMAELSRDVRQRAAGG